MGILNNLALPSIRIIILKETAISDSGATRHFLIPGVPVLNLQKTKSPIQIALPNGTYIESTRECELDIPELPKAAQ